MSIIIGDTVVDNSYTNQNPKIDFVSDLSGYFFAFDASGGFAVQEGFRNIVVNPISKLVQIDTTNTVQITMDYKYINSLIGISYKYIDGSYNIISATDTYIDASGIFIGDPSDNVVMNAQQFISNITTESVLSVGSLSTLYTDYYSYIQQVFQPSAGSTVFTTSNIDVSNSLLDANGFIALISSLSPSYGYQPTNTNAYITDLSGSITISNISQILRYSCTYNIFNNRPAGRFTVYDAFQPGDLIYVPGGIQVVLNVGLTNNSLTGIENLIDSNIIGPIAVNNGKATGIESVVTDAITQLSTITRTIQVPLLIILKDLHVMPGQVPYVLSL
jgi:hypothetical protein